MKRRHSMDANLPALALAAALVVGLILPAVARAEHTRNWRESQYVEFDRGTPQGVALRSDGKLLPAPSFSEYSDPNLAYLWALRLDSRGRLYAAGGSSAKVLRFDDPAKPTTVFESSELAAQAIAFDAHDNLYVGTSPDGKVYKVTPEGAKSVFFDPKTKYIWALAVDAQGALYVATGDTGEVFVVNPDGKGRLFYQGDERHARSLAFDRQGNLLIGTDPDGLILRVEIQRKDAQALPEAGAAYVIYETSKKEVTSLLCDAEGNIYAASIGDKPREPGLPQPVPVISPAQQQAVVMAAQANAAAQAQRQPQTMQPTITFPYFPGTGGGAEVVKISPDGSPEIIWNSREDLVFAMDLASDGKLLLGTGNKGGVIKLEGDKVFSKIASASSAQVMGLATSPDGKIFVATANPGKLFTLGPGSATSGSFESDDFDARIFSRWGRISWWGENGAANGKVEMYVRSGNTSTPDNNWSAWAGPYKNGAGEAVSCPAARFAQWKAVFVETDHGAEPDISWVSLGYLPKNVAPEIDDIVVEDPGVRAQGYPGQEGGPGTQTPVQLRMPQQAGLGGGFPGMQQNMENAARQSKMQVPPQGFKERGYQSVVWAAHDDNDDDLVFSIYYRGESETNWRLLKDKITERFYSWDTQTMPDGAYYLKIVASDLPSNPAGQALTAERVSERLEVANTPPRIENLHADAKGATATIRFDATSASRNLGRAQYSVDAGDWQVVFPVGQLSDAPKESYQIELTGLVPGEHTVAVQTADDFGNTAAAKVTFAAGTPPKK